MINNFNLEFNIDKSQNKIFLNKHFNSDIKSVWNAFTKKELLDLWWAPKPWQAQTRQMNFNNGGHRLYAMVGPEGQTHWSIELYKYIKENETIIFQAAFADADGNINKELPISEWEILFSDEKDITKVAITITHVTLDALEQIIKMGFKEGFAMAISELENTLKSIGGK